MAEENGKDGEFLVGEKGGGYFNRLLVVAVAASEVVRVARKDKRDGSYFRVRGECFEELRVALAALKGG